MIISTSLSSIYYYNQLWFVHAEKSIEYHVTIQLVPAKVLFVDLTWMNSRNIINKFTELILHSATSSRLISSCIACYFCILFLLLLLFYSLSLWLKFSSCIFFFVFDYVIYLNTVTTGNCHSHEVCVAHGLLWARFENQKDNELQKEKKHIASTGRAKQQLYSNITLQQTCY